MEVPLLEAVKMAVQVHERILTQDRNWDRVQARTESQPPGEPFPSRESVLFMITVAFWLEHVHGKSHTTRKQRKQMLGTFCQYMMMLESIQPKLLALLSIIGTEGGFESNTLPDLKDKISDGYLNYLLVQWVLLLIDLKWRTEEKEMVSN